MNKCNTADKCATQFCRNHCKQECCAKTCKEKGCNYEFCKKYCPDECPQCEVRCKSEAQCKNEFCHTKCATQCVPLVCKTKESCKDHFCLNNAPICKDKQQNKQENQNAPIRKAKARSKQDKLNANIRKAKARSKLWYETIILEPTEEVNTLATAPPQEIIHVSNETAGIKKLDPKLAVGGMTYEAAKKLCEEKV